MPTSEVFQLFLDVNKFYKFNKLISSTTRQLDIKTSLCIKLEGYM